jgi:DNA-binding transcriptional regulator YhcF (GntR family)
MAKQRQQPARAKALNYLIQAITTGEFGAEQPLLPVSDLAARAKVSPVSMCKALAFLKQRGILRGVHGRRYHVNANAGLEAPAILEEPEEPSRRAEPLRQVWERTAHAIKQDILQDFYSENSVFPSIKELKHRYNVTYPTLKKALDSLVEEKFILPYKRSYKVKSVSMPKKGGYIIFCGAGFRDGRTILGDLNEKVFHTMEMACSRHGIRLYSYSWFIEGETVRFAQAARGQSNDIPADDWCLGFFMLIGSPFMRNEIALNKIVAHRKPIAILNEVPDWHVPRLLSRHPIQVFNVAVSSRPAEMMARLLIELGHKHIAYISPYHQFHWSKTRYKTLCDSYHSLGKDHSVKAFTTLSRQPDTDIRVVVETAHKECDIRQVAEFYEKWKKNVPSKYIEDLDQAFADIGNIVLPNAAEKFQHYSLLNRALRDRSITAWVMANDKFALRAMAYLKQRKIEVPGKISIVGFDNTIDAALYGLTSYDFNMSANVQRMLDFVLNPQQHRRMRASKPVEIDGMIIERSSTRALH